MCSGVYAQTPSASVAVSGVPAWFNRCAGENVPCIVYGDAQAIFGSAAGDLPQVNGHFVTQVVHGTFVCSNALFGDPDGGHAKACWYGPVAGLNAGKILTVGGSDYPFFVQNFEQWDSNQRQIIGCYNQDPTLVEAQLRQLYKSGQRHVSLVLWYMPFGTSASPAEWLYSSAFIDSSAGHLPAPFQSNLVAVLGLIRQIGFTEVTLRLAPVGPASPVTWGNSWNESQFQQDEAFEFSTRQLMEATLAGTSLPRVYDLGVEVAGIPHTLNGDGITFADGQSFTWTSRLWADYVSRYGTADSFGFSIAYRFGNLTTAIAQYDAGGARPTRYAIDDYANDNFWQVYQELVGAHEVSKPLVLQEVSYNDNSQAGSLQTSLGHFPLLIASVNQWPVNAANAHADASPPTNYGAYGGSSDPSGTLVVAPCSLAAGQTTCTTQASWSTSNATNAALFVNGVQASNLPNIATTLTGTTTITLGLGTTNLLLASSQGSLNQTAAASSNATAGQTTVASQTATAMDPVAPVITSAGLGGSNQQSIWAIGSNLSSACSVQIYDGATGTATLATLANVGCAPTFLGFTLPDAVSKNYSSIKFTVANPGSAPSIPYSLPIQPIPTLTAAGLGGVHNGAIWAVGKNISASCSVRLYDPRSSSAPILTLSGLTCDTTDLSFPVPAAVAGSYSLINLTVVDSDGQESGPVPVGLH